MIYTLVKLREVPWAFFRRNFKWPLQVLPLVLMVFEFGWALPWQLDYWHPAYPYLAWGLFAATGVALILLAVATYRGWQWALIGVRQAWMRELLKHPEKRLYPERYYQTDSARNVYTRFVGANLNENALVATLAQYNDNRDGMDVRANKQ